MVRPGLPRRGWLDEIAVDRPTLMVTEGVLPYLTAADVRQLFVRLTDRLPSGELIFDGVAGPTARMSKLFQWSLGDPWEIERWNPGSPSSTSSQWSQTSNGSPTADTAPSSN